MMTLYFHNYSSQDVSRRQPETYVRVLYVYFSNTSLLIDLLMHITYLINKHVYENHLDS